MENNNTQWGDKPDFDKMANEWVASQPPHGNIGLNAFPANLAFKAGALRIWTDYVAPLHSRIRELEAENEELRKKGEWISVNERLPQIGQEVWINTEYYRANGTYLGSDQYGIKFREGMQFPRYNFVTHWQPLPSKPENK